MAESLLAAVGHRLEVRQAEVLLLVLDVIFHANDWLWGALAEERNVLGIYRHRADQCKKTN